MKPAVERFKGGDIIRYAGGVSALFRYDGVHSAGSLYGTHIMGGSHSACDMNFFPLQLASEEDIEFCKRRRPDWFETPASNSSATATDIDLAGVVLARWRDRFPNNAYAWPGSPDSFAIEAVRAVRSLLAQGES